MDIRNLTQFYNFIKSNNLVELDMTFQAFSRCVDDYTAMCNCGSKDKKKNKYDECNRLYIQSVSSAIKLSRQFLEKTGQPINFYYDEMNFIKTLSS